MAEVNNVYRDVIPYNLCDCQSARHTCQINGDVKLELNLIYISDQLKCDVYYLRGNETEKFVL